jgi:hypothetical protein
VSRPIQLKITEDVTIILNNVVSYSVEKGVAYRKPKPTATADEDGQYAVEDYDVKAADTISIFFIGGNGLTFRVGEEITREDFDRVSKSLKILEFKLRDEGNSSCDRIAEAA